MSNLERRVFFCSSTFCFSWHLEANGEVISTRNSGREINISVILYECVSVPIYKSLSVIQAHEIFFP